MTDSSLKNNAGYIWCKSIKFDCFVISSTSCRESVGDHRWLGHRGLTMHSRYHCDGCYSDAEVAIKCYFLNFYATFTQGWIHVKNCHISILISILGLILKNFWCTFLEFSWNSRLEFDFKFILVCELVLWHLKANVLIGPSLTYCSVELLTNNFY